MGNLHTTPIGSFKIGDREYPLARVTLEEGGKKYDAAARKAWLAELAGE